MRELTVLKHYEVNEWRKKRDEHAGLQSIENYSHFVIFQLNLIFNSPEGVIGLDIAKAQVLVKVYRSEDRCDLVQGCDTKS